MNMHAMTMWLTDAATVVVGADLTLNPWRHNNVGGVNAGQARHNSSNVGGVTAGQGRHNSSVCNVAKVASDVNILTSFVIVSYIPTWR